eukprot:g446.t1
MTTALQVGTVVAVLGALVAHYGELHWGNNVIKGAAVAWFAATAIVFAALTVDNETLRKKTGVTHVRSSSHKSDGEGGMPPPRLILGTSPPQTLDVFRRIGRMAENPFVNATTILTLWQRAKLAVGITTLLPLRLPLLLLGFLGMIGFARISAIGLSEEDLQKKPMTGFRARIRSLAYPSFRLGMFGLGIVYVRSSGTRVGREEASIIVPNHSTMLDMIVGCVYGACGVSKIENARIPLVGHAFRALQMVLVDRSSSASREDTKRVIQRRATEDGWPQTVIFAEGTCTNRSSICSFKAGAFAAGVPVQPVAVRYTTAGSMDPSLVRAGPQLGRLAIRLMATIHTGVHLTYLPVVAPEKDAKVFAEKVRRVIAEELGLRSTQFAFGDVQLMTRASKKLRMPCVDVPIEFNAVRNVLGGLTVSVSLRLLETFAKIGAGRKNGSIRVKDLCSFLEGSRLEAEEIQRLFVLMDEHGKGKVCLRQFIVFCLLLSLDPASATPANVDDARAIVAGVFLGADAKDIATRLGAGTAEKSSRKGQREETEIALMVARHLAKLLSGDAFL